MLKFMLMVSLFCSGVDEPLIFFDDDLGVTRSLDHCFNKEEVWKLKSKWGSRDLDRVVTQCLPIDPKVQLKLMQGLME